MSILRLLSIFYMGIFVLILFAGSFKNIRVARIFYSLSIIFALCVGIWGFSLEPSVRLDLYRLHNYVRSLEFGAGSFFSKIWGAKGMLGVDSTEGMIGWNLLCYIVQGIGDVHWLSAIGSFLTFFNVLFIFVDYIRSEGLTSKTLGIGVLLAFMGLPIQYVLSGIRNALAVSLVMLSLYLFFYKKQSHILSILLILAAATIHTACLFAVVPIFFVRSKRQIVWRAAGLFSMPLIFAVANALRSVSIPFLSVMFNRVLFYTNVEYQYDRPEMIANIVVFVSVAYVYWHHKRRGLIEEKSDLQTYYINAYYLLGSIMIGCSVHRDFTLRVGYIMGIAAFPVLSKILLCEHDNRTATYMNYVLVLILLVCCGKVYYDMFAVISQWTFS